MMQTNLRRFMSENDNLADITTILEESGIILYPTDTIWGIGCDATNQTAVDKIYQLIGYELNYSLNILVDSTSMLKEYIEQLHPRIETLLGFHNRPLTVIYENARNLPKSLVTANGSIPIRLVQDDFCKDIISRLGRPIVAAQAKKGMSLIPSSIGKISSEIISGVDYIVNHRRNEVLDTKPAVIITHDSKGEITFLSD